MKWSKPAKLTKRCRLDCGKGFIIIEDPLKDGYSYRLEYPDPIVGRKWLRMDKNRVKDRDAAYEEHLRLRLKFAEEGTAEPDRNVTTFSEGMAIYLADKRSDRLRSYGAIEGVMQNRIEPFFGELLLRNITSQTVKNYLSHRRRTVLDSTIKIEMSYLREFFNLMIEREHYSGINPVSLRRLKFQIPSREVFMSSEQEKVIWPLLKKYPPMEDIADFIFGTAMRPGNIITLSWERILWDKQEAFVPKEAHKQKMKDGHYLLSSEVLKMLRRRQKANEENGRFPLVFCRYEAGKSKEIKIRWLERQWEKIMEEAGIEDLHFYDLKHTMLSRIAAKGASVFQLKCISNHSSTTSLEKYIKKDALKESARSFLE